MEVAERLQHFSLLPSTSLAIGYYNNFLRRVFEAFEHSEKIKIIEKDASGKKIAETECDIVNRYPTIEVQIPQNLVELDQDSFKRRTAGLKQIVVETKIRPFPFYIEGDFVNGKKFKLFDIPTTMFASYLAIKRIFTDEFLERENNFKLIESREIANFERTLRILVPDKIREGLFQVLCVNVIPCVAATLLDTRRRRAHEESSCIVDRHRVRGTLARTGGCLGP